jgi:hypothetical protein
MKPYILLLLSAVGIGTLAMSASSATPMSGVAIDAAASANQMTRNVRWCGRGCGTWGYSGGWGPDWSYRGWSPGACHCQPSRCGPWQSPGAVECVNFVFPGISQRPVWCGCRPSAS